MTADGRTSGDEARTPERRDDCADDVMQSLRGGG